VKFLRDIEFGRLHSEDHVQASHGSNGDDHGEVGDETADVGRKETLELYVIFDQSINQNSFSTHTERFTDLGKLNFPVVVRF
jgi:hypothetical protein